MCVGRGGGVSGELLRQLSVPHHQVSFLWKTDAGISVCVWGGGRGGGGGVSSELLKQLSVPHHQVSFL